MDTQNDPRVFFSPSPDFDEEKTVYLNYYQHDVEECGCKWVDIWDCIIGDECPECGEDVQPYKSKAITT